MLRLLAVVVAVAVASCGEAPRGQPILALGDLLRFAETRHEPGLIDLGTPAASLLQLDGWSWSETPAPGLTLVWGVAPRSRLSVFVLEPRDLRLRGRCMPYDIPGAEPQTVRVEINAEPAGELELAEGWQDVVLELPERLLRRGSNELTFTYSRAASPASLGRSRDGRWLGVAWDWIEIGTRPTLHARADPDGGLLLLPAGTRTDFFFDLPVAARFSAQLARRSSSGLRVEALVDGATRSESAELGGGTREVELELRPGLTRLRLETPFGESGPGESLGLRNAQITSTQALPREPPEDDAPSLCLPSGKPDVFVYLIDTLRADHLGVYGYSPESSPEIARLASEAVLFEAAIAQSSWTKASVASIFTGLWPWSHGVQGLEDRLPENLPSLPDLLSDGGYQSAGVVANPHVSEVFGFERGFDDFQLLEELTTPAETVHAKMLEALDRLAADEPIFAYLHTIDPHAPYAPGEPYRSRFAASVDDLGVGTVEALAARAHLGKAPSAEELGVLRSLYDAEIAYNDYELGRFLDGLRERGLYEDALIILVSDHGEEFYDHGDWVHGKTLYGEVINVPLLIKFPGGRGAGTRVSVPAQQIDLLPTILDCANLEAPVGLQGESLAYAAPAGSARHDRPALSYLHYSRYNGASVVLGEWKLVVPIPGSPSIAQELYHRLEDPREERNLAAERPVVAGYLASLLRRALAEPPGVRSEPVALDPETAERLRALGYIN